jgi:large subunit ribosomal protein L6
MSRIGKQPVALPEKVTVEVSPRELKVAGPRGELRSPIPQGITCVQEDNTLVFSRKNDSPHVRSCHGLARALAANAVRGVSVGFTRELDIVGVGFRAEEKGRAVLFHLGYSHPIEYPLPDGIEVKVDKQTHLVVSGADKQQVGQVAAVMRSLRKPDPYKNKGVRYTNEVLRKKAGKAAGGAG